MRGRSLVRLPPPLPALHPGKRGGYNPRENMRQVRSWRGLDARSSPNRFSRIHQIPPPLSVATHTPGEERGRMMALVATATAAAAAVGLVGVVTYHPPRYTRRFWEAIDGSATDGSIAIVCRPVAFLLLHKLGHRARSPRP